MRTLPAAALMPVLMMFAGCSQTTDLKGHANFGGPVDCASAVSLSEAVALAEKDIAKPVRVRGRIAEVCANRGCWMMLSDDTHRVRIRFTASEQCTDGFLVPRNAAGHQAYVEGKIKIEEITEEAARHYAEDLGKSKEEIERIVGPQPEVRIIATGVVISDGASLEPPVG